MCWCSVVQRQFKGAAKKGFNVFKFCASAAIWWWPRRMVAAALLDERKAWFSGSASRGGARWRRLQIFAFGTQVQHWSKQRLWSRFFQHCPLSFKTSFQLIASKANPVLIYFMNTNGSKLLVLWHFTWENVFGLKMSCLLVFDNILTPVWTNFEIFMNVLAASPLRLPGMAAEDGAITNGWASPCVGQVAKCRKWAVVLTFWYFACVLILYLCSGACGCTDALSVCKLVGAAGHRLQAVHWILNSSK